MEIDEQIAKAEHLVVIASECGFKEIAAEIERDMRVTKAWRDIVSEPP